MQLYAIQLIWIFAIFLRLFKLFFLMIVREKPAQARDPSKTPARAFVRDRRAKIRGLPRLRRGSQRADRGPVIANNAQIGADRGPDRRLS
jgi:hypothetical protein